MTSPQRSLPTSSPQPFFQGPGTLPGAPAPAAPSSSPDVRSGSLLLRSILTSSRHRRGREGWPRRPGSADRVCTWEPGCPHAATRGRSRCQVTQEPGTGWAWGPESENFTPEPGLLSAAQVCQEGGRNTSHLTVGKPASDSTLRKHLAGEAPSHWGPWASSGVLARSSSPCLLALALLHCHAALPAKHTGLRSARVPGSRGPRCLFGRCGAIRQHCFTLHFPQHLQE